MKNNPQYEQMEDESMIKCLDAQAQAIWPHEKQIFSAYDLAANINILDLGCGTGEISSRLLHLFPNSTLTAADMIQSHLDYAAQKYTELTDRLTFKQTDAMHLDMPHNVIDLTVCRHMLQAVPDAQQVLQHMVNVTKPGGTIHILAEDYGMLHFSNSKPDLDAFWRTGPMQFGIKTGTDLRSGRKMVHYAHAAGLENIRCEIISIDNLNTHRETFSDIFRAWKAGYLEVIVEQTELSEQQTNEAFDCMIECVEDPMHYALWNIPVISANKPSL